MPHERESLRGYATGLLAYLTAMMLASAVTSGCRKSSLETVPVRGTVTYHGKGVPYGMVKFQPTDAGRGRAALATIAPDGSYEVHTLSDARGLVPGHYQVTVAVEQPPGLGDDRRQAPPAGKTTEKFPPLVRSDIQLTVEAGERAKVFDISLDGK
jgi:hypothetical protein